MIADWLKPNQFLDFQVERLILTKDHRKLIKYSLLLQYRALCWRPTRDIIGGTRRRTHQRPQPVQDRYSLDGKYLLGVFEIIQA